MQHEEIEAELERHHRAGYAWALACCGRNREEAEDVLQTSYLKILDGRARWEARSAFRTFLFGVVRKTASEHRRRAAVRRLFALRPDRVEPLPGAPGPGTEERLALVAALAALPRRQREVLHLVFYAGTTLDEAAEALGISPGSARVHYDRGKRSLARRLGIERAR